MKKVCTVLISIMLLLTATACGNSTTDETDTTPTVAETDTTTTTASAETSDSPSAEAATIAETVLVDEAGVKITATGLDPDGFMGPELKLLIENNTDKNLTFQNTHAVINGYMVTAMLSTDVVSGKKANDTLTFLSSDLEECQIDVIADLEISFHAFESDNWEDYLDTDLITLKTSVADTYTYSYDDSGDIAYDKDGLKIVIKGITEDEFLGPRLMVYIENNTADSVSVQTNGVSINGFMVTDYFSAEVLSGKHAVSGIDFLTSDLEDNGIETIDNIEFSFHIIDSESWETLDDSETVALSF